MHTDKVFECPAWACVCVQIETDKKYNKISTSSCSVKEEKLHYKRV